MSRDKQNEYYELERLLRVRKIDIEKQGCDLYSLLHKTESEEESIANYLIGHGYRKASDVAKEVCAEIGKRFKSLLGMLPAEGALTDAKTFIDAHWEFIEHSIVFAYDAELKKKYTENKGE